MRRLTAILGLGAFVLGGVLMSTDFSSEADAAAKADGKAKRSAKNVLRHVVMFQFKESSSKEDIDRIVKEFASLPKKINEIVDFEWGTDVSVEGKSGGLTHCFIVTFRNEKGRDAYLPHAAHQEFVKLVGPHVKNVLVFDYAAQSAK